MLLEFILALQVQQDSDSMLGEKAWAYFTQIGTLLGSFFISDSKFARCDVPNWFMTTILDRILYSPGVPVFRPDDSTALNREPCYVSVITCAAVNQNLALREHTCAEVNGVMSTRVLKILQVPCR